MAVGVLGAKAQTYRERGAYLVNGLAVCGNCHTPKDAEGYSLWNCARSLDPAGHFRPIPNPSCRRMA